jgi:Cys-rich protein (TIGR01571 family)
MTQPTVFVAPVAYPQLPASLWNDSILDCFKDMGSCCEVFMCTPCQMGYQYEMLTHGERRMNFPLVIGVMLLDAMVTGGCAMKVLALHLRTEVRRRFNITPGEDVSEFCQWFWCTPCSVCQTYRELTARGMWPGAVCVSTPPPLPVAMGQTVPEQMEAEQYPAKAQPAQF